VKKALNAYAKTILFDTGKATIKSESAGVLQNIIGILQEYPNAKFNVEGYTDSVGSEASNQKLSQERASSVMNYLITNGVASDRLNAKGFGESNPIDSNKTAAGRANNRRVEINLNKN
jgi:outer membrane protein OmpA-like peptidoglycan-associated protein